MSLLLVAFKVLNVGVYSMHRVKYTNFCIASFSVPHKQGLNARLFFDSFSVATHLRVNSCLVSNAGSMNVGSSPGCLEIFREENDQKGRGRRGLELCKSRQSEPVGTRAWQFLDVLRHDRSGVCRVPGWCSVPFLFTICKPLMRTLRRHP